MEQVSLFSFYRWGNWSSRMWGDSCKVTQLRRGRARSRTQVLQIKSLYSFQKKKKRQLSLEITKNCKILSLKGNNRRHNFRWSHLLKITQLISSKAKSRLQDSLHYSADPWRNSLKNKKLSAYNKHLACSSCWAWMKIIHFFFCFPD